MEGEGKMSRSCAKRELFSGVHFKKFKKKIDKSSLVMLKDVQLRLLHFPFLWVMNQ